MTYNIDVMEDIFSSLVVGGFISLENVRDQLGTDYMDFLLWLGISEDAPNNPEIATREVRLATVMQYLESLP